MSTRHLIQKNVYRNFALDHITLIYSDELDKKYFKNIERFITCLEDLEEERKEGLSGYGLSFEDFYKKYFPLMLKVGGTTITHKWIDFIDDTFLSTRVLCDIQTAIEDLEKEMDKLHVDEDELWEILHLLRAALRQVRRSKLRIHTIDKLRNIIVDDIAAEIPDDLFEKCSRMLTRYIKKNCVSLVSDKRMTRTSKLFILSQLGE